MHFIPSVDFTIEIFRFIRVKFAFSIYILHNTRDYSLLNIVNKRENKSLEYRFFFFQNDTMSEDSLNKQYLIFRCK